MLCTVFSRTLLIMTSAQVIRVTLVNFGTSVGIYINYVKWQEVIIDKLNIIMMQENDAKWEKVVSVVFYGIAVLYLRCFTILYPALPQHKILLKGTQWTSHEHTRKHTKIPYGATRWKITSDYTTDNLLSLPYLTHRKEINSDNLVWSSHVWV
jgi:hypothetical protein